MFISIDIAATADFSARQWLEFSAVARRFAHILEHRRHCIFLTPLQLNSILSNCDLGTQERKILEGTYGSRIQDFGQWFRNSKARLTVNPQQKRIEIECEEGRHEVFLNATEFLKLDLLSPSGLLAEHIRNDAEWYLGISDFIYEKLELVGLANGSTPIHGGGGNLISHFERLEKNAEICACIVDRDAPGPWANIGRQARTSLKHAGSSRLILKGELGSSKCRAFFSIRATEFRNVSNSVPPAAVNLFFTSIHPSPINARAFSDLFPSFPVLTSDEWKVWMGYDFEKGMSADDFKSCFEGRIPTRLLGRIVAAISAGAQPRIPKSMTAKIIDWSRRVEGGSVTLSGIISEALSVPEYEGQLISTLSDACHFGAAFRNFAN